MAAALKKTAFLFALGGALFAAAQAGLWLDVPFVKQEKNGCGAASIAMVMQYWRKQPAGAGLPDSVSDPATIQQTLYSRKGHGIYASDLEDYFRQHGFTVFAFSGTWDDLKQHLEKGRPVIVALKPSRLESSLHYVVIAGVDETRGLALMNDPAQRKLLSQPRREFEKEWSGAGHWTLLAVPQTPAR